MNDCKEWALLWVSADWPKGRNGAETRASELAKAQASEWAGILYLFLWTFLFGYNPGILPTNQHNWPIVWDTGMDTNRLQ